VVLRPAILQPCSVLLATDPYYKGKCDWNAKEDVQPGYDLCGYLSKMWTESTALYRGYEVGVIRKPEMLDKGSSVLTDAGYSNI